MGDFELHEFWFWESNEEMLTYKDELLVIPREKDYPGETIYQIVFETHQDAPLLYRFHHCISLDPKDITGSPKQDTLSVKLPSTVTQRKQGLPASQGNPAVAVNVRERLTGDLELQTSRYCLTDPGVDEHGAVLHPGAQVRLTYRAKKANSPFRLEHATAFPKDPSGQPRWGPPVEATLEKHRLAWGYRLLLNVAAFVVCLWLFSLLSRAGQAPRTTGEPSQGS